MKSLALALLTWITDVAICFPYLESTPFPPVLTYCVDFIHEQNIFSETLYLLRFTPKY